MTPDSSPLHTLLVHSPKLDSHFGPVGSADAIHMMAVGLPALAEAMSRTGRPTRVMHLGVERRVDPSFDLAQEARRLGPRVVGLSLHWHPQTWHTIQAARTLRKALPDAFIVLGGFTASAFDDQILAQEPAIDGVIRGDGEVPLVELARALDELRPLSEVPNLSFRSAGQVVRNPISHTASTASLSELGFERFDLVRHHRTYIRDCGLHFVPHSRRRLWLMRTAQSVFGGSGRFMVLPAGRGCSVNCAWCGGGFGAHKRHHGRTGPVRLLPGRLAASVARAVDWGFKGVHACFDPHPDTPDHWVEVCDRVRGSQVRTGMLFESFRLPHPRLVRALAATFRSPTIAISPESPREAVRHKVRGLPFSNDELVAAVADCAGEGVQVLLSFGLGLPGEDAAALDEAVALHARCQAAARRQSAGAKVLLRTFPITLEPASPWSRTPERYGIVPTRTTFSDYLAAHRPGHTGPEAGLGYVLPEFFGDAPALDPHAFASRLQEAACKRMCPLPPGPTWGHLTCRTLRSVGRSGQVSCTA